MRCARGRYKLKSIREQIEEVASEMMGIDPSEINDDTSFDEIFFPLTQKLDEIFHANLYNNHGNYESSELKSIVDYYEEVLSDETI